MKKLRLELRSRPGWALAVVGLAVAMTGSAAKAQDRGAWFAGGTVDSVKFGYAGAVVALPGSSLGKGWAARTTASAGRYRYNSSGARVQGEFKGADLALVRQWSGDWGWFNTAVSGRFMSTDLTPDDRGNRSRGDNVDAALAIDGARLAGPWRMQGFAAYGVRLQNYQVRASVTHAVARGVRLGAEAGADGNDAYAHRLVGGFAGVALSPRLELQIGAGVSDQNQRPSRGYLSIGFVGVF